MTMASGRRTAAAAGTSAIILLIALGAPVAPVLTGAALAFGWLSWRSAGSH